MLTEELAEVGIAIPTFVIENVSVPPEVEQALDKRTSMGAVGDLDRYTRFQAANAMEAAANNPGGEAGAGIGLGMGMAMGQQMARSMGGGAATQPAQPAPAQPAAAEPPPLPGQAQWYVGVGGQRQGPYDLGALTEQANAGALGADTLVWRTGMAQWRARRAGARACVGARQRPAAASAAMSDTAVSPPSYQCGGAARGSSSRPARPH
ncbi:GYF domain-containing protein [Micromonospora sp. BRA006-A]|nr:GYF domain-containing protein [Micromonospora sp. BRA006-A]